MFYAPRKVCDFMRHFLFVGFRFSIMSLFCRGYNGKVYKMRLMGFVII